MIFVKLGKGGYSIRPKGFSRSCSFVRGMYITDDPKIIKALRTSPSYGRVFWEQGEKEIPVTPTVNVKVGKLTSKDFGDDADLDNLNKKELIQYASNEGVQADPSMTMKEIREAIRNKEDKPVKEEVEEEVKEEVKEEVEKEVEETESEKVDYEEMLKADLIAEAVKLGVKNVDEKMTKKEIIALIGSLSVSAVENVKEEEKTEE